MSFLVKNSDRIGLIDALRGFAIAVILVIHVQYCFSPFSPHFALSQPSWLNFLDDSSFLLIQYMFGGKVYSIFAMLFGVTFYIQSYNQLKKGVDFGYRFLWRMFLLLIFGLIDSIFYVGDILAIYAILGVVLFAVRKWSDRSVLILAFIFLLQPIEWILLFVGLFKSENIVLSNYLLFTTIVYDYDDLKSFFLTNLTLGIKDNIFALITGGRLFQIPGLFLIGYLIGRRKLLMINSQNIRFWIYVLIGSSLFCAFCISMRSIVPKPHLYIIFDMWYNLAFTFVLVSSFVLLYQNVRFVKLTSGLCYLGRMTLTLYIFQSIVGVFLFLPIGFGLGTMIGCLGLSLCGLVLIYLQIVFCRWWLSSHRQGPLEMIWHKLTIMFCGDWFVYYRQRSVEMIWNKLTWIDKR